MGKKKKRTNKQETFVDPSIWAKKYLTPDDQLDLKNSLNIDVPISIRVNCLKSEPEYLISTLNRIYGWDADPIPFTNSGFWIYPSDNSVSSTIEHRLGYYYIQEAASMLPAELFDFQGNPEPLILDMAASPGGKTIHLIDRTMDKGLVIANDASRSRIPALRVVLENWGAINQGITCQQGEWFGYALPETFDAVLLDAPCSMQGLRVSTSHKARPITENEISILAERQSNLLVSALQCVKVGGTVVYSTCTLSPQENEGVLAAIIKKFSGAIEILDIQGHLPKPAPALTHIDRTRLPAEISRGARLWPHIFNTAGFFSAKLVKKNRFKSSDNIHQEIFDNHIVKSQKNDENGIIEQVEDQFGFELRNVMEEQHLTVVENNGNHFLAAEQLIAMQSYLPITAFGMPLGKPLPGSWQPSHTLVSRFGDRFTRNVTILDDTFLMQWARGEDIRGVSYPAIEPGTVVAIRDTAGRNLGRGKILKDRIKNQLPTRLF